MTLAYMLERFFFISLAILRTAAKSLHCPISRLCHQRWTKIAHSINGSTTRFNHLRGDFDIVGAHDASLGLEAPQSS